MFFWYYTKTKNYQQTFFKKSMAAKSNGNVMTETNLL